MPSLDRRRLLVASGALAAGAAAAPLAAQTSATSDLRGMSILVTGCSSGFGRLGALLYARAGAKVFATMRNLPRAEAAELEATARAEKLDLAVLPLDVLSDRQVAATIAEAQRRSGGALDVLVNNAGINIAGPVELQDMEAMKLSFDTNVYGLQRTARAVLPAMRARRKGLIVNISSQQGRFVMPASGVYAPTKFAVEAMSEQMAYELAPHGVEVCIIQPGGFPTGIGANRARLSAALAGRVDAERAAAYPDMVARMKAPPPAPRPAGAEPSPEARAAMAAAMGSPTVPDPIDVPRTIAEIAAMTPGSRPLRRMVHPGFKPQAEINRVSEETQRRLMSRGPMADWAKAVLD
jgi:NAD(P)-dependent dehydrogenase (short-subunit alcohol dehydrogenase family)